MSWYNTAGACPAFVLFSKVRYIRNIAKQNFHPLTDSKKNADSFSRAESVLKKNGFRQEKLLQGVNSAILSLAEKQFIERDIVYTDKQRALYLNEPCSLIVSLGGENLITISSIVSGLSVDEAKNIASGAEELLDREISLAYSDKIGYLSPICSQSGSGLCFSAALYLPSLRLCNNFGRMCSAAQKFGMTLSPMLSSDGNPGDIYIISHTPHYLACENSSAAYFSDTVSAFVEKEKNTLLSLFNDRLDTLLNNAYRALGAMLYSRSISECEMLKYLSTVRLYLSVAQSADKGLPDLTALNYLSAEGLNCSVISSSKSKCNTQSECDSARASLIRSYIEHKSEVSG